MWVLLEYNAASVQLYCGWGVTDVVVVVTTCLKFFVRAFHACGDAAL
jgi:hypothetical protein